MTATDLYGKLTSINFTVRNISPQRKKITVFNYPIEFGQTRDLLAIPEISEDNIRSSLVKGELANKVRAGDIRIVSSSINLLQFDTEQKVFIENVLDSPSTTPGVDPGTIGGGGAGTTIQDGGTIGGTYEGNVLCLGQVTVSDTLEVKGSLIVRGDFINNNGYEVTVRGDLFAQSILFSRADSSLSQNNFTVDGDLFFTFMEFNQSGGSSAQLRVGGDLTGTAGFSGTVIKANGTEDTSGLNILVYGDLTVSDLGISGGDSLNSSAGSGGNITVYGNMNVWYQLRTMGGDADNTGYDAGNGGQVEVYGNFTMGDGSNNVDFSGGYANNGNAGNGGTLEVHGNCVLTNGDGDVQFWGGECSSDIESHRSGSGGNVYVYGNLQCDNDLELGGGSRYGTLSNPGSTEPPHGGNLTVKGDARVDEIDVDAGGIYTTGYSPCTNGGNGGSISVLGNLVVDEEIYGQGSYVEYGNCGNGSFIEIGGNLTVGEQIDIDGPGGNNAGNAGSAGTLYVYGNAVIGGNIDAGGGYSDYGNAGNGGIIEITGSLVCYNIYADGGNCNSVNENNYAGNGGNVLASSFVNDDSYIYLSAGERSGATTVPNVSNTIASPGYLSVKGDCIANSIYISGSVVNTDYPNSAGGNGGQIEVGGNLIAETLSNEGGDSDGNNAGRAGSIYIDGSLNLIYLDCYGGNANDSNVGGDAGTNGSGPSTVEVKNGIVCNYCNLKDGNGIGLAPSDTVTLFLYGNNAISVLSMTDRPEVYAKPGSNNSVSILKMREFNDSKNTLNNYSNVPSENISASVSTHIYMSNGVSWHSIAGTTIFP